MMRFNTLNQALLCGKQGVITRVWQAECDKSDPYAVVSNAFLLKSATCRGLIYHTLRTQPTYNVHHTSPISIMTRWLPYHKDVQFLMDCLSHLDEEPVSPDDEEVADSLVPISSTSQGNVATSNTDIEPGLVSTPLPVTPLPVAAPVGVVNRRTRKSLWYGSSGLALLVILGIILFITHQSQSTIHQSAALRPTNLAVMIFLYKKVALSIQERATLRSFSNGRCDSSSVSASRRFDAHVPRSP